MSAARAVRPSYRRAILIYILAIVGPTLALLYLGLQSVRRQRLAIDSLTVSNLRLSGERLATELERRTWELARACLRDPSLTQLRLALDDAASPESARRMRAQMARIRERHPIAGHFFILQGDTVRFPLLRTPPPRRLEADLGTESKGVARQFAALFAEGENQELRQQRPDQALAAYRQCYGLRVSDSLKALALARVARCLRKSNEARKAEEAYRTLEARYGDIYDAFYRPYALVAGIELDDLTRIQGGSSAPLLRPLQHDLVSGRWELSAEQMDYFLAALAARLGGSATGTEETEYLSHFELARAAEKAFRRPGPRGTEGEVYAYAFTHNQSSYQTYYTPLPGEVAQGTVVGFAVNLNWVENHLLPQCRSDLSMEENVGVTWRAAQKAPARESAPATQVSFPTLFPFWELSVAPASAEARQAAARSDVLVFAGSTLLILGVLVLGVFLLMRDVSRELELGRLRADFVSGVSHELKTPLTLIRLYGETLLHGQDFTEEERRSFSEIITRESERLTHLIEKVLDFSRIDQGQKEYYLREGNLAPVIAQTVQAYAHYLMRRGFSIQSDLAPQLPPVQFDGDAISQAVLNLMDNAAKYSGDSKFVGVRLRVEDNRVVFEVEDHGIGIPSSEREKIFQKFYRAPSDLGKGGYGLGLFLVRHIMDAHAGSIELESERGRGSLFRLIFPERALRPVVQPPQAR